MNLVLHSMKTEGTTDFLTLFRFLIELTSLFHLGNWLLPNRLQLSVAAGVLAGIFFAVKYSSNGFTRSDEPWLVPGLQNLGNNCFLNVILQALSSCSSFRRYLWMNLEECGFPSIEESYENLPLASALASILDHLCVVQQERSVVSPRQLMFGLGLHLPDFDLSSQQDAEEALYHLLSSLREELRACNFLNHGSLADVTAEFNFRVITSKLGAKESEQQRWEHFFLRPFDGILGNTISCQSCSSQISLEFQSFLSLQLSPPVYSGRIIKPGCSVEDCLKRFFVSERLENHSCSHCWHRAAVEYLSFMGGHEMDIDLLLRCNKGDSCRCKDFPSLRALPWSKTFSRCFKKSSLARSPQILCIHLQRASVNIFGQPEKLLGHISFPLILDLSPFMYNTGGGVQVENSDSPTQTRQQQQQQTAFTHQNNNPHFSWNPRSEGVTCSREQVYRLVSVVEHFGTVESGHYTVYRRVEAEMEGGGGGEEEEEDSRTQTMWFSISDSNVSQVSPIDVLQAQPTLLFYEKF